VNPNDIAWCRPQWFAADGSVFGYVNAEGRLVRVDCAKRQAIGAIGIPLPREWVSPYWDNQGAGFHRLILTTLRTRSSRDENRLPECAVWDRDGRLLRHFVLPKARSPGTLSHDGRTMAMSVPKEGTFLIETATGQPRGHLRDAVGMLDFSPDGTLLATSCADPPSILLWDMARPLSGKAVLPAPKNASEAEPLWELLCEPDPTESDRALCALVAASELTLPLLSRHLKQEPAPDAKRLQALVALLDSNSFQERERATQELQVPGREGSARLAGRWPGRVAGTGPSPGRPDRSL
jgi:hypothetical protein